jgi:hypothetical protein
MYLWVIIVTFLASLAVLGTSLRTDIKEVYVEPQAEAVISKLFIQHRGLVKYALQGEHVPGDELKPGLWYPEEHKSYFAYGFKADSRFKSRIYCLDQHGNIPEQCTTAPESCCKEQGQILYLITYGKLPPKWQSRKTGLPRPELINAMRNNGNTVDGMGYFDSYEHAISTCDGLMCMFYTQTEWGVVSQNTKVFYGIPDAIMNDENSDFREQCMDSLGETDKSKYCLMYVSKF